MKVVASRRFGFALTVARLSTSMVVAVNLPEPERVNVPVPVMVTVPRLAVPSIARAVSPSTTIIASPDVGSVPPLQLPLE